MIKFIIGKVSENQGCKKHFQKQEKKILPERGKGVRENPVANTELVSNCKCWEPLPEVGNTPRWPGDLGAQ